eukprot:CAMPEP_0116133820 /NCGR_PEP_ID=MMETSP0329-20121206/10314_1 /TAXON_ID=697910 /ORGANISM="Pseudo-nitzschia arenysensis, Strain B593" /LENGTH=891 /DNA_ID=CAMNT_0003628485 /DNA_START=18 /DNA_END=2693 /DNA_ORIENTATION=-
MTATGEENMYKAILKEIGAEESYMEYLFEESDDDDDDDEVGYADPKGEEIGDFVRRDTPTQQLDVQKLLKEVASSDDHMLSQYQSETEESGVDSPNKVDEYVHTSSETSDSSIPGQVPTWKRMLDVANAKQKQVMEQMTSLQNAQRQSSPRNKIRVTVNLKKASEDDERSFASPLVLKEIHENDSNLNSSMHSSNTISQVSKRNGTLQGQWQSQQEKSNKLQDQLVVMQSKYYNQQQQWEKDKQELFSPLPPARSPSKIPKWSSPAKTPNGPKVDTPRYNETTENNFDTFTPKSTLLSSEKASNEELELSKALIQELEKQLEESQRVQQSQREELRDCKDRLKKRDVEHKAFLLQYETEKKSWQDETKENQAKYQEDVQSRDDELKDTRQKLQEQMGINKELREKVRDESKDPTPDAIALNEELALIKNQMKSEMEENQKKAAYIQELEEENQRLKTESIRKTDLENTQDEIKLQMKLAIEDQTKKTREFQSRIRELEGRHTEELDYWKSEVEDHRRQIELNSTRMENQLEEANARFADLERKHDKEVKEWQMLLDADITNAIEDDSHYEEAESHENLMVIGGGGTGTDALSPIRKDKNKSAYNSPNNDSKALVNESMNMIDGLLHELGEMDLERTAILKEINGDNDDESRKTDGGMEGNHAGTQSYGDEPPKPMESPEKIEDDVDRKNVDVSVESSESEVLDETLHLLNNLKSMLTSQENVNEHENTVLERLEVLSELMQSQEHSRLENTPAKPRIVETHDVQNISSSSAVHETSVALSVSHVNARDSSFVSAVESSAGMNPWPAFVAELKSRCEFLERDRDEVTRITEQILEMERAAHKAELEAAVAEVERKANEKLHKMQLEANQEMNAFYRNICFQCEEEAFDYSDE